MGYLRLRDYEKQIQLQNLDQITSNDPGLVGLVNQLAQEEMTSYLIQKYNTAFEFTDTPVFDYAASYLAADRFYLDFAAFNALATYAVGDTVSVGTAQYVATAANGPGAFDPADWFKMGQQYDIFYVNFPYQRFNYLGLYQAGNRVWWENKVYQCLRDTLLPDHQTILQARVYRNIGPPNAMPGVTTFVGALNDSAAQWGVGTPFSITGAQAVQYLIGAIPAWSSVTAYAAGDVATFSSTQFPGIDTWYALQSNTNVEPGADIVNWLPFSETKADNRSQQMVQLMADIALYHIHSRIAPRNIPELRELRYKRALEWLQDAARGRVTPINLELNQPEVGNRITFGGNIKHINSY